MLSTASQVSVTPDVVAPAPMHAQAVSIAGSSASDHVNAAVVRDQLIRFVDTWNGGQGGKFGTSGMGTYASNWDGLFRVNLDRQFNAIHYYTDDQTIISQSRALYMNIEAYRNSSGADQNRFKNAVQKGADYLLSHASDPATYNGNAGGMWWGLQSDGVSPPTHTGDTFGNRPREKQAYGQVQTILALALSYTVTGDAKLLDGAMKQLAVWNTQFADTAAGAGAYLPSANENYTQRVDTRNIDYMTHALEAMETVWDVLPANDPRRAVVATQIANIGNFITTKLYRDAAGSTSEGYLPWYYDAAWQPSSDPAQRYVTPGHNFEMAFLLSRAAERGFNANWLNVAGKLVAFAVKYGFDNNPSSPSYGAVVADKLNFNGTRFNSTPDDLIWWQTAEATRSLLHFAAVRGRSDLWDEFDAAQSFINNHFVDSSYNGWYPQLSPTTLAPTVTNKGNVWTAGYHEAMLYAEMLRLAPMPAQSTPFSGFPVVIAASGATTIQAENYDIGGEGVAYHDSDATNSGGIYRNDGVDLQGTSDIGGGYNVGWTTAGEWLNYSVDVASAGTYAVDVRVANIGSGGTFHLELDGANVTGPMGVPNTGGWQNWNTVSKSVNIPAGKHILRLVMDSVATSGAVGNFNDIRFSSTVAQGQTPFKGTPFAVGASAVTIEAEDFDRGGEGVAWHDSDASNNGGQYRSTEAVDLEASNDTGGGYNVGWIQAGEWLEYTINVSTAGLFKAEIRAASTGANGAVHLEIDGSDVSGKLVIPNTGGWQSWTTLSKASVNLPAGQHVLRLAMDTNGSGGWVGNVNWIRFSPASTPPPGGMPYRPVSIGSAGATVEAEDFDLGGEGVAYHDNDAANNGGQYRTGEAVDVQVSSDAGGGYNLGWTSSGEWLKYTVSVTDAGSYAIDFRVASNGAGGTFHLESDGVDVTGGLTVPNTFGWQNWSTITKRGVNLTGGTHVLRLVMDSVGASSATANFNWIKFTKTA
ncbi:MAG TPA: carbohydrate-binding protein [Tepidisphaeraceae bacterium]